MTIWYMCILWKDFHIWSNTSIILYIYLFVCMWEYLSSTLRKFWLCNTEFSLIVIMLLFIFSDFILLLTEGLYPFTKFSLFPQPPVLCDLKSALNRNSQFSGCLVIFYYKYGNNALFNFLYPKQKTEVLPFFFL